MISTDARFGTEVLTKRSGGDLDRRSVQGVAPIWDVLEVVFRLKVNFYYYLLGRLEVVGLEFEGRTGIV